MKKILVGFLFLVILVFACSGQVNDLPYTEEATIIIDNLVNK